MQGEDLYAGFPYLQHSKGQLTLSGLFRGVAWFDRVLHLYSCCIAYYYNYLFFAFLFKGLEGKVQQFTEWLMSQPVSYFDT